MMRTTSLCLPVSAVLHSHYLSERLISVTFSKPMSITTAVCNITLVVLFKPYLIPWPVEHSAKITNIYILYMYKRFHILCTYLVCDMSHLQVYPVHLIKTFSDNRTVSERCICNLNISDLKGGCQLHGNQLHGKVKHQRLLWLTLLALA